MAESEQSRAQEYRRKMQTREDNKLARERALAGDPARRKALQESTDPVRPWKGWDPIRRVVGDEE